MRTESLENRNIKGAKEDGQVKEDQGIQSRGQCEVLKKAMMQKLRDMKCKESCATGRRTGGGFKNPWTW